MSVDQIHHYQPSARVAEHDSSSSVVQTAARQLTQFPAVLTTAAAAGAILVEELARRVAAVQGAGSSVPGAHVSRTRRHEEVVVRRPK